MRSLKAAFPNISKDQLWAKLLLQSEAAVDQFGCKIDIDAFNYSAALTASGLYIPVTYHGNEKGMLRVVKPDTWELKELPVLKFLEGRGAVSVLNTATNKFDGKAVENVVLLERTRSSHKNDSHKLANMVLINGHDDEATRIMVDVVKQIHKAKNVPMAKRLVPDYSKRAGDIKQALNDNRVPFDLKKAFEKVASLQEAYIKHTVNKQTLLHGRPGHYNIVQTENFPDGGYVATNFDPLWGAPSSDYAFMLTNPWDLETVIAPGRMEGQVAIISEMTGISRTELLNAVIIHSALASCWGPLNPARKGNVDQASLDYWESVMKHSAGLAKFNLK